MTATLVARFRPGRICGSLLVCPATPSYPYFRTRGAAADKSSAMPWKSLAKLDDEELGALHAYLHTLLEQ